MFMVELNLSPTDYAILHAIEALHRDHTLITGEMIAMQIRCTPRTVYRHLNWMLGAKIIKRESGSARQGGYKYVKC